MTVVENLTTGGVFDGTPRSPLVADYVFPPQTAIPKLVVPKDVYQGLPFAPRIGIPGRLNEPRIEGIAGNERGLFMEGRLADIIFIHPKVKEIMMHSQEDPQDGKGHDMTVYFTKDSGIEPIHIQVKSRQENISTYRRKISARLKLAGSKLTTNEWLILDRTIALNGALENEQEILYNFVIGVASILKRYDELSKTHQYIELFEPPIAA